MEAVKRPCINVPYLELCSNVSMRSLIRIVNDLCCQLAFYIVPRGAKLYIICTKVCKVVIFTDSQIFVLFAIVNFIRFMSAYFVSMSEKISLRINIKDFSQPGHAVYLGIQHFVWEHGSSSWGFWDEIFVSMATQECYSEITESSLKNSNTLLYSAENSNTVTLQKLEAMLDCRAGMCRLVYTFTVCTHFCPHSHSH